MIISPVKSRQKIRSAWSIERLTRERSIALGSCINLSTLQSYGSALNSYLNFIRIHKLPSRPSADTLSLYVVYMCHHIEPRSVQTYLAGITNQLEIYYPDVRNQRNSPLVVNTLKGCMKLLSSRTKRKLPLSLDHLKIVIDHYANSTNHDDLLFVALLLSGFHALLRLGEITIPNNPALRDDRKIIPVSSLKMFPDRFKFLLPTHKADAFFEGNRVVIRRNNRPTDPYKPFISYLKSRDNLFPLRRELWLCSDGCHPTRSFFINRIRLFFDSSIAGQSMRAGGATFLAECGMAPHLIQATGRWSSDAFLRYIRKNPILIHALTLAKLHVDDSFHCGS